MTFRTDYERYRAGQSARFDWSAVHDNYEPGDPIGYGFTEQEAINDLVELLEEREGRREDYEEASYLERIGAER